jgi:hypothetical protein
MKIYIERCGFDRGTILFHPELSRLIIRGAIEFAATLQALTGGRISVPRLSSPAA